MKAMIGGFIGLVWVVCALAEPLIEGRVRLDSGEPVTDAQVQLFDMTDLQRGSIALATTDGTGYFALPWAALTGRALPARFTLGPNYPNPFNPSTIIPYQLAASSAVRLEVFNLLGQRLATLVDGERPAGFYTAQWHATDEAGRAVGAGVYIYRMTVGMERQTGRMVLVDGQAGIPAGGAASVMPGASGSDESNEGVQVYGLTVSGAGLVPYVDSAFRIEAGMAPVELVVSSGVHSAGKVTDDDCPLCGLFGGFNDEQDEEEEDLIVSASVSNSIPTPGQAFTLRARVQNQGTDAFQDLVLSYYRSSDAAISTQDMLLGTDEVGSLAASSTSGNESIRLTASSTSGTYYYGACVASVSDEDDTPTYCSTGVRVIVADADDSVAIPDANLRTAIEDRLKKARGATITKDEMTTLTTLRAANSGIRALTGLEFATNLTWLRLEHNNLSDVSALSGLTKLITLNLDSNNVSDISPLGGLTNLRTLYLNGNNVSDISPLGGLTNLRTLLLDSNNISDISPLRDLTNLSSLELNGNNVSDISPLGGLTNLRALLLDGNNVSDISPLGGLTNLSTLYLNGNNVSDVSPLRGLTNLHTLYLNGNNVSDVSPLGGLTHLEYLNLSSNAISDVSPLRGLTRLRELDLRGNSLNDSSVNDHIPALQRIKVTVRFDWLREGSDFDIELVFLSTDFTQQQKRMIRYAARRWMSIIREDLPDYTFASGWSGHCGDPSYRIPAGERIDDLRIYVISSDDDPDYDWTGVAGWGGVRLLRETSHLSVVGCMAFNLDDNFVSLSTALHEIGHVLGIGTHPWDEHGFVQRSLGDVHFNGPRAIAAFNAAGGRNYTGKKVPLEEDWSHWRASVLKGELMRADGAGDALSAITIQSLADVGYVVDVTQADPYTLHSAAAKVAATGSTPDDRLPGRLAPKRTCGVGQQREPIYVIDPQGRVVRTLQR